VSDELDLNRSPAGSPSVSIIPGRRPPPERWSSSRTACVIRRRHSSEEDTRCRRNQRKFTAKAARAIGEPLRQTRSLIQVPSTIWPALASNTGTLQASDDGSYDLYFGPKAPDGKESNWVETIPGKSWFPVVRPDTDSAAAATANSTAHSTPSSSTDICTTQQPRTTSHAASPKAKQPATPSAYSSATSHATSTAYSTTKRR
jgi:hypothetical protein